MQIKNGIDLIEISRIKKSYDTFGDRLLNRIYDQSEINVFLKKSLVAKATFLAKNFAAKEAVSKVLGTGFTKGIRPKDIVIKNSLPQRCKRPTIPRRSRRASKGYRGHGT